MSCSSSDPSKKEGKSMMTHDDRRKAEREEIERVKRKVLLLFGRPPRTNAEKRRAVNYVLEGDGFGCSNGWIARACMVSRSLVAMVRKEAERDHQIGKARDALWCAWFNVERAWRLAPEAARKRFVDFESRAAAGPADDLLRALSSARVLNDIDADIL